MFGFASPVMALVARRTVAIVALALAASAWIIIAGEVPNASAALSCDSNNHCYAEGVNLNSNTNHGVYGEVYAHCLYQPNNGNFATNEVWDSTQTNTYWEEAGVISGVDTNGNYDNKNWFWADKRPSGGFNFHLTNGNQANTDTTYPTKIYFAGNNTWYIYGGNSFYQIGTSTSQSASLNNDIGGTEYFGGSGSGIRDVGDVYNLQRKSSSDTWYSWDTNAINENLGSGHYISGQYHGSGSYESWSGPC